MKGDRVHRIAVEPVVFSHTLTGGITASNYMLDIPRILSEDIGKNLPVCAVYDVSKVRISMRPSGSSDEDVGFVVCGSWSYFSPTRAAVAALKWAMREWKAEKRADYATPRGMQFAPKIAPFLGAPDDAIYSRRDDNGLIYSLTGATDATYYGIAADYNDQKPKYVTPAARTGAQPQTTEYYTDPVLETMRAQAWFEFGYGIGTGERFANNSTGPEDAATPYLTLAAEDPNVWVHHTRYPTFIREFVLEAPPGRSMPVLLGQSLFSFLQSYPIRKTGMWGGTETATARVELEVLGWHELR